MIHLVTSVTKLWQRLVWRQPEFFGLELEQTVLRLIAAGLVCLYLVASQNLYSVARDLPYWSAYLVLSAALAYSLWRSRRPSVVRRIVANLADVAGITYLLASSGEAAIPLFAVYLLVTLGNGRRFGMPALVLSAALSLTGFAIVWMISEVWRQHMVLSIGVWAALLAVPAYFAHLLRQSQRVGQRAEELMVAKSQFLTRMSHDLRTPLNGIHGTAELLRNSRRLTNEERRLLGVIQDSVTLSLRQIDNMLVFARIAAGKLVIEQVEFDLHRLLQDAMRVTRVATGASKLRLLVRIDPSAPYRLIGDPHHLRVVLLNLLANAVKFTTTGYIALEVMPLAVGAEHVTLRFEVRDTGVGIEPDILSSIQGGVVENHLDTGRHSAGAGLGITIVRKLVELMGGRFGVASETGRGTVFWYELRYRRQPGESDAVMPAARILMVSADVTLQEQYRRCADALGSTLFTASSVAEAVASLTRGIRLGNHWHLVLVDDAQAEPAAQSLLTVFLDKALAVDIPVYLITDQHHGADQLRAWGYAGHLPRLPSPGLVANVVHASRYEEDIATSSPTVLHVAPRRPAKASEVRRRVLIADDNRTNLLILRQILEDDGYEVDDEIEGERALERIAAGGYKAAVIDLHMPGFDGVHLLRRYRLLQPSLRIPIIMLTSDATFDAQSNSAEAGADAFLTKPVSAELLRTTLDQLIREREVRRLPIAVGDERELPGDSPVLDMSVLADLDRVCHDPVRLKAVVSTFQSEGEMLLIRLADAQEAYDYALFGEWVHAMKGNAANIGAHRLAAICRRIERGGEADFQREGAQWVRELRDQFAQACTALRELSLPIAATGSSGEGRPETSGGGA